MEVEGKILDVRRLGLPAEGRTRTILVTLDSSFTKRMVLASLAKLRNYEKKIFLSPDLSDKEVELEQAALKKRKELILNGESRNNLRIRKLQLEVKSDGQWTPAQ